MLRMDDDLKPKITDKADTGDLLEALWRLPYCILRKLEEGEKEDNG